MILTEFAEHLLTMLVGERSLAINRAAMASSELAEVLLAAGRFTAGPIVEKYLARLDDTAALQILNPAAASASCTASSRTPRFARRPPAPSTCSWD